jgi:glycosyltransferase involved in cell wall biosynthesis
MNIGVFTDLRFTSLKNPTGVTKHIYNIVKGLHNNLSNNLVLLVTKDQVDNLGKVPESNSLNFLNVRVLPYTWHQIQFLGLIFSFPNLDKFTNDLDLVYCPKNDFLPLRKTPYIATFHGAHELDPDYPNSINFKNKYLAIKSFINYKKIVKQASHIVTVSEFLKNKSNQQFSTELSKTIVIGNGVEEDFFEIGNFQSYNIDGHYIAVGGLNFLDGGDRLINIAKYLKKINSSKEIWIAGDQHDPELLNVAKELNNIKLLGYLNKDLLAKVMAKSSALLFFTRYETFGIAAVEAMAVGIPVFTLRSTAVPEIVGSAGFYFDNDELNIEEIFNNFDLIQEKILLGKKRADDFHWNNCVERLENLLMKIK